MDGDGTGLVQTLGDHHVAEGAVQSRHLDHIKALIRPVDVSCGGLRRNKHVLMCSNSYPGLTFLFLMQHELAGKIETDIETVQRFPSCIILQWQLKEPTAHTIQV